MQSWGTKLPGFGLFIWVPFKDTGGLWLILRVGKIEVEKDDSQCLSGTHMALYVKNLDQGHFAA